jgi:ATP-dependent DNA helicase RecG
MVRGLRLLRRERLAVSRDVVRRRLRGPVSRAVALTPADYLVNRRLADHRGRQLRLRRAAELAFAKEGPEHPNAGVRIFRVIGTDRRTGPEHNVEELPRIEGPVAKVLAEAYAVVGGLLRRPSRLVGDRFRPASEYPEFSWKEAVLNAVAHRDYASQGRGVEVWMFDDRMEVVSPGGLIAETSLEDLLRLRRVHASRNPRLVRALVDLGGMRNQGEGIPRMFAEMEGAFLPRPTLEVTPREFRVTLRNTPTLSTQDRAFVASLGSEELTQEELRALLEASRHGRVDHSRILAY